MDQGRSIVFKDEFKSIVFRAAREDHFTDGIEQEQALKQAWETVSNQFGELIEDLPPNDDKLYAEFRDWLNEQR